MSDMSFNDQRAFLAAITRLNRSGYNIVPSGIPGLWGVTFPGDLGHRELTTNQLKQVIAESLQ